MTPTPLTLNDSLHQRLHRLSTRAGQSPEAVLDAALADYERKLLSQDRPASSPRASAEPDLLDDPGRIRLPHREAKSVSASVKLAERRAPRVYQDEE